MKSSDAPVGPISLLLKSSPTIFSPPLLKKDAKYDDPLSLKKLDADKN